MLELFRASFRFNAWANELLLGALEGAEVPPENAVRAYQHVIQSERGWYIRLLGQTEPWQQSWGQADLALCRTWTADVAVASQAFLANLNDAGLQVECAYESPRGERYPSTVERVLQHLIVHSAQYRGEAAGFANAAGVRVPNLDLFIWQVLGEPSA